MLFWLFSLGASGTTFRLLITLALAAVCACELSAQTPIPVTDGAARLVSFTGQISIMRGSTPWALNVGDAVEPEQIIVTGPDGYGQFQVADGSTFEVFPKSRIVFRANRGDWRDLLEVWLGKVRVQIEHLGGLPNRNKVRTPTAVISVRGTVFDVEVEDENDTTLVVDEEGQVEVRHLLTVSQPRLLNAGEWIRVYKNEPLARKMIDRGSLLERAFRAASDAFIQATLNSRTGAGRGVTPAGGGVSSPGDKNTGNPPPPSPPPPPPPPPAVPAP